LLGRQVDKKSKRGKGKGRKGGVSGIVKNKAHDARSKLRKKIHENGVRGGGDSGK